MSEFPDVGKPPSGPAGPAPFGVGAATAAADPVVTTRDDDEQRGPMAAALALVREVALVLVIALGLSLLIKTLLVQAFFIPSASMENTLLTGDRVLVSKLTPGPFALHRGDVVVFADPDHWLPAAPAAQDGRLRDGLKSGLTFVGLLPADTNQHLIKRLIGLPGDHVVCCDPVGRLTVNGAPLSEPYIFPGAVPSETNFSVVVPPGHIWVMGDNRDNSEDSRAHLDQPGAGMVPISDVVGKTFVKVWPVKRIGLLHNPTSTFAKVPAP